MIILAFLLSMVFAANIGACGTAASIGAAYGGGAVRNRMLALGLAAGFAFLGAYYGGGQVVATLSHGIIPARLMNTQLIVTVIASACLTLLAGGFSAVPLSTSEVTVGAVVGAGLAYRAVYAVKLLTIVAAWIGFPFAALFLAAVLGRLAAPLERRMARARFVLGVRILTVLLILSGCYEAFSAGMNNVASAVGPLVGAGLMKPQPAMLIGGLFLMIGILGFGGRVLETHAKQITRLSLLRSIAVSCTVGTLSVAASLFGLPVPVTQATTMAVFGIGAADQGGKFWRQPIVKKVVKVWLLSPLISLTISFVMVQTFVMGNRYGLGILGGFAIAGSVYAVFKRMNPAPALGRDKVEMKVRVPSSKI